MTRKYKVTGVGNAIVDILALVEDNFLNDNSFEKGSMSLIEKEDVQRLSRLDSKKVCSGGSVANSIVAMANFGSSNAFIGKVGNGHFGDIFVSDLAKVGVDFCSKNRGDEDATARSFVLVTPDAQRTMCTYLGEASDIGNQINEDVIGDTDIVYLEGYLWDKPETIVALKKIIRIAKEKNTKIAFTLSDSFCVMRHKEDFLELIHDIDILFANEDEIEALLGTKALDLDKVKDLAKGNDDLVIIVTRSEKGAVIFDKKNNELHLVPAKKIDNLVDTTGAGDAFAAGFLHGLHEGRTLIDSTKIGNLFAGKIIQKLGARFEEEEIKELKQQL